MNRSISDSGIPTVEIYTWRFCPFCLRAKALLNEKWATEGRTAKQHKKWLAKQVGKKTTQWGSR